MNYLVKPALKASVNFFTADGILPGFVLSVRPLDLSKQAVPGRTPRIHAVEIQTERGVVVNVPCDPAATVPNTWHYPDAVLPGWGASETAAAEADPDAPAPPTLRERTLAKQNPQTDGGSSEPRATAPPKKPKNKGGANVPVSPEPTEQPS